ncbi:MAG TPA: hypothetical protein VFC46_03655 [Humisphaera sp.]|nr:hypothetical protein [Humisphaera sp.]
MTFTLRPEIERLIGDQLKAGRFSTREELIEAAIIELCHDDANEIHNDISAAIDEGRAQCDRGEGIPLEDVRAHWRKRLHGG